MNFSFGKKILFFSLFLIVFFIFLFWSVNSVFALEINYPRLPGATPPQDFLNTAPPEKILPLYVFYIFNLIIWISGIITFGVVVYAGIRYLTSAGKPEVIISARNQISSAFLGILLLLSSFLILRMLNTQLVVLEIPEPEPIEKVERPETPSPPAEFHLSSINTEIPFAKIIEERVFASSSMAKIKKDSQKTLEIAEDLKEQNEDLKEKTDQCSCNQAKPDCDDCSTYCTKGCTCDVCKNVRDDINEIEEDNLGKIDELKPVQEKIEEEIRLLKEELDKLERAEKLILECKIAPLASLAEFLGAKKFYTANKWLILDIKFWDTILTIEDWANFYCPVSGTIWGGPLPEETTTTFVELPAETEEVMACTTEIPVGEIIDRAIRIGNALVAKLETLNNLSKNLMNEVNQMHYQVSRCSSQQPMCCTICIRIKHVCIKFCTGQACPRSDIKKQLEKIQKIQSQIEEVVNGEIKENQGGIIPIINNVVPKLLEDVDKLIRKPMKQCISEISPEILAEQPQVSLSSCESSLRAIGPKGKIIENCCYEQPEFKECLNKCYLEKGQENYKKCLEECLRKKAEELKNSGKTREGEIIATCRHKINFYCCGK